MSKISALSACFHYVFTAFPYENLKEKGFNIDSNDQSGTEVAGLVTQTLLIGESSISEKKSPIALEFLEITDEVEFVSHFRKQNLGLKGRELLRPGLRFWAHQKTNEGSTQSETKLVGSIPIQILSVPASSTITTNLVGRHPNSVDSVWGVYLGLSSTQKEEWSQLLGQEPNKENQWILTDGTRIQCATPGDGLYDFMEGRKDFPFWAVVLQSQSLDLAAKHFEFDKTFHWKNQKAFLIKEHLTDWDLIVV